VSESIPFGILAELSVTLAGFASLIAVLRNRSVSQWHPRVRFNFLLTLTYSLSALLFSLIPSLLADISVTSWLAPIALLLFAAGVMGYFIVREHRRLRAMGLGLKATATWAIGWILASVAIGLMILALVGLWISPAGAYHFAVCILLMLSALSFVGALQYPVEEA